MTYHATDTAETDPLAFDTGVLRGRFHFLDKDGQLRGHSSVFPGVRECVYLPLDASLVNATAPNALFMPEWVLKPGGPRNACLWDNASFIQPEPIEGGIRVRYPDEALASAGLRCTLEYRVHADMILLDAHIEATREHTNVELLFASYIPNRLNATYVPLHANDGIAWDRIPRKTPWKCAYFISSSDETTCWRHDDRFIDGKQLGDWSEVYDSQQPFAAPILVAIEESSGLAAVHFVDDHCTQLCGQYHPKDTAHDFCWGWPSLRAGEKILARAALWVGQLDEVHADPMQQILDRYHKWKQSWGGGAR